jgi:hypothetical protein
VETFRLVERKFIARVMIHLFAAWDVSDQDGAFLLGVSDATYRTFREGEAIPDDTAIIARAGVLQDILLSLYRSYGGKMVKNYAAYRWVKTPNIVFRGKSPLEKMKEDGLTSIIEVRNYLHDTRNAARS